VSARCSDAEAAELYDVLNPWGPSDAFYLGLVMEAPSALDVGCGTGRLLHRARESGHTGRLCGVDPDGAMLGLARRRPDVEWVEAAASAITLAGEFELAVMNGHVFQVLTGDDELRESLRAIHRALVDEGRFAFETRNPARRAWERWHGMELEAVDASGRPLLVRYDVQSVRGDLVTFTETTGERDRTPLRVDRSTLRFLDVETLDRFLTEAGFAVEARYGGWTHGPYGSLSDEIVTVAEKLGRLPTKGETACHGDRHALGQA
jgi:ubiquinone/menaquinone biosynthesis C-methylase UbiE